MAHDSRSSSWWIVSASGLVYAAQGTTVLAYQEWMPDGPTRAIAIGLAFAVEAAASSLSRFFAPTLVTGLSPKTLLAITPLFVALCLLMTSVSSDVWWLVACRLLLGAFVGLTLGIASIWITDFATSSAHAGELAGRVGLVNYVGLALFTPMGALLAAGVGVRLSLVACAAFPLLGLVVSRFASGSSRAPLEGTRLSGRTAGPPRRARVFAASAGVILIGAAIPYGALISIGPRIAANASPWLASSAIALYGLTIVLTRLTVGVFSRSGTVRFTSHIHLAVLAVCCGWLGLVSENAIIVCVGLVVMGIGSAVLFPAVVAWFIHSWGAQGRGLVGIFGSFTIAGYGAGSLLGGVLIGSARPQVAVAGIALAAVALCSLGVGCSRWLASCALRARDAV